MREIKFRGKRIDNGEWVYGYYVCYGGAIPEPTHHIIHARDNLNRLVGENYEVDPATVGQYIDLKNKNGQEIYKGDILACGDASVPTEIRWHDESHAFYAYNIMRKEWHRLDRYFKRFIGEIVGNVHDNPEMVGRE